MSPVIDPAPATLRAAKPRRLGRWAGIIVLSSIVHLAVLDGLPRWTIAPADDPADSEPLRATLLPPVRSVEPPPTPAAAPTPTPMPPAPRTTPRKAAPRVVPRSFDPLPRADVAPLPAPAAAVAVPGASVDPPAAPAVPTPPAPPPPQPAPPLPSATPPRSARLNYKVVAVDLKNFNAVTYRGIGAIDWSVVDGRYRSDIVAAVDLLLVKLDVLASHSEGAVTPRGLAPDRYTESPRRRATVATNFNRDARQSITFSASSASVPLVPGAQDRLSVLFQIGALLLVAGQPPPGGKVDIPVAGIRGDVETWSFQVQGSETIEVGTGPLATTHLRRTPRPDTNDRTIDVWIAVQDGGYPGRVLYTEPNGSTIDMILEKIGAVS